MGGGSEPPSFAPDLWDDALVSLRDPRAAHYGHSALPCPGRLPGPMSGMPPLCVMQPLLKLQPRCRQVVRSFSQPDTTDGRVTARAHVAAASPGG